VVFGAGKDERMAIKPGWQGRFAEDVEVGDVCVQPGDGTAGTCWRC